MAVLCALALLLVVSPAALAQQVKINDAAAASFDDSQVREIRLYFGPQTADVSYGRTPDGGAVWKLLSAPTPGAANAEARPDAAPPPR